MKYLYFCFVIEFDLFFFFIAIKIVINLNHIFTEKIKALPWVNLNLFSFHSWLKIRNGEFSVQL